MSNTTALEMVDKLIDANQKLTSLLGAANEREISLRAELHSAKTRIESCEKHEVELVQRIDRLQQKYDELHSEYVRRIGTMVDRKGNTSAKSDVNINM